MNKKISTLAIAALFSIAAVSANAATYKKLDSLGGNSNFPYFINDSGQIVGSSALDSGVPKSVLWSITNSTPIKFEGLDGGSGLKNGQAKSINDFGKMVGSTQNGSSAYRATFWDSSSPNSPTQLESLGGTSKIGYADAINNSGNVVGTSQNSSNVYQATLWSSTNPNSPTLLSSLDSTKEGYAMAINDSGNIVGYSKNSSNVDKGTFWNITSPNLPTLLESLGGTAKSGRALFIDDLGEKIVGYSQNSNNVFQATLWTSTNPNSPTLLASLGGSDAVGRAYSINDSGTIVGFSRSSSSGSDLATLWHNGGVTNLNSFLDASTVADGWTLRQALSINDNGDVVGWAYNTISKTNTGFLLQSVTAPVPEADTSAMLLMGAGVMGFIARRRKQAAA